MLERGRKAGRAAKRVVPPLGGSRFIPETDDERDLAKKLRNKSFGRLVEYAGIGAWAFSSAGIFAGSEFGLLTHSWDPVIHGAEASVGLFCGGAAVAAAGWGYKHVENGAAKKIAERIGDDSDDPLADWVNAYGKVSAASTALTVANFITLVGAVSVPPPFDIALGALHVGGRVVHATKYAHTFAIEKEAWGQLYGPIRRIWPKK